MKKIVGLVTIILILSAVKVYAVTGDLNFWIWNSSSNVLRPANSISSGTVQINNLFATNTVFINATSTNLFANALTFTNATGTSLVLDSGGASYALKINQGYIDIGGAEMHYSGGLYVTEASAGQFSISSDSGVTYARLNAGNLTGERQFDFQDTDGTLAILEESQTWSGTQTFNGLTFTTASGTSITSTNLYVSSLANITKLGVNTSSPIAQLAVSAVAGTEPMRVVSSTNAQLFAVKPNGQVVVGPNSLAQTGQLTIEHPTTNDVALSFTNGTHYTFQLGRVAGTSGQAFIGGPVGTSLNLRAGGTDRVFILNTNGYVGINSTTPSTQLVVVGTSTFNGAIFQTGLGDCSLDTQTLNYNSTTGLFTCLTDDTGSGGGVNNVGTSTENYFTFYTSSTAVTGTPWMTFANGALTVTTNTNFTIVSSTNALFGSVTTTNLYVSGRVGINHNDLQALDGGTVGEYYHLSSVSYNYLGGFAGGCYDGKLIWNDDVAGTCSSDLVWNYLETPMRLYVNGSIDSTGDLTSTNAVFLGDTTAVNGTFSGDLDVTGSLTVGGTLTLGGLTIASTTINSLGVETNGVIVNFLPRNRTTEMVVSLTDPDVIPMPVASTATGAFYSDDITRMLTCATTASTGAVSLKNSILNAVNTGNSAFYHSGGTLQTITATNLFGAGYSMRGCVTVEGFHYVLGVSTTAASNKVWVKSITSTYSDSIATAGNWQTVSFTVATPSTTVVGLVGAAKFSGSNTTSLVFASSTTSFVRAGINSNTSITPVPSEACTNGSASLSISNARANQTGYIFGFGSAPFNRHHNLTCANTTYLGTGWGQTAPASAGPDLFGTKCSWYSLAGTMLYKVKGYSGC